MMSIRTELWIRIQNYGTRSGSRMMVPDPDLEWWYEIRVQNDGTISGSRNDVTRSTSRSRSDLFDKNIKIFATFPSNVRIRPVKHTGKYSLQNLAASHYVHLLVKVKICQLFSLPDFKGDIKSRIRIPTQDPNTGCRPSHSFSTRIKGHGRNHGMSKLLPSFLLG